MSYKLMDVTICLARPKRRKDTSASPVLQKMLFCSTGWRKLVLFSRTFRVQFPGFNHIRRR